MREWAGEGKVQGENATFSSRQKIKSKVGEGLIPAPLLPGFVLLGKLLPFSEPLVFIFIKWGDNDNT